jgi:MFS family permease
MTTAKPAAERQANYVLVLLMLGYLFGFLDRQVIGIIAPDLIKEFGLTDTQMGLLQGIAFSLLYTLIGIPLGWAVDRFNRKWLMATGMALWSGMTALCGSATTFFQLFMFRLGVGVGEAALNPCASSMISDLFKPEKRPRAFGIYTMGTALAGIVNVLIVGVVLVAIRGQATVDVPLFGEMKPWQVVFLAVGLPGLIPAFLMAFTTREPERSGQAARKKGNATLQETRDFVWSNRRALLCILLGASLVILEVYAGAYWHTTIMLRQFGWTPLETLWKINLLGACFGIFSAFSSAWVTNYFKRKGHADGVLFTIGIGAIGCTIFGALGPLMPTAETAAAMLILKSFFVNYGPAATVNAINEVAPNEHRGMVTALYVIFTGLISQGFGPASAGLLSDNVYTGPGALGMGLSTIVVLTGFAAVLLLLYGRKGYQRALANVTWEKPAGAAAAHG